MTTRARLNGSLLVAASLLAIADAAANLALIQPGHAAELNPLAAALGPTELLAAKAAGIALIAVLTAAIAGSRILTIVLAVAAVGWLLGTLTTIAAAAA